MRYKNRHILYGIIILFLLVFILWISYFVYIELIRPNRNDRHHITQSSAKEEIEQNKLFVEKSFVFSAPYMKDQQLNFPMINLNSKDAETANQQIRTQYENLYQEKTQLTKIGQNVISKYQYHVHQDILSILIYIQHRENGKVTYSYMTYHFYLSSGNFVRYQDVYQAAGIYDFNIEYRVEEALHQWIDTNTQLTKEEKNQFVENMMTEYRNEVTNGSLRYYLDADHHLNLVLSIQMPNEVETTDQLFVI